MSFGRSLRDPDVERARVREVRSARLAAGLARFRPKYTDLLGGRDVPAGRVHRRVQGRAVGGARVAAVLIAFLVCACMETRRSLGEDCLKNDDCLSGVCAQFLCASAPPTINTPRTAPPADAEPDEGAVVPEDAPDGPEGTATDSSTDSDADETDLGD